MEHLFSDLLEYGGKQVPQVRFEICCSKSANNYLIPSEGTKTNQVESLLKVMIADSWQTHLNINAHVNMATGLSRQEAFIALIVLFQLALLFKYVEIENKGKHLHKQIWIPSSESQNFTMQLQTNV